MEYTVNQESIKVYAEKLAADLCRNFFVNKAFIAGPEILAFNGENQLNLLIVKNIFLNWQKETLKLKSAFFDFEDDGVKQALKSFMNKLSNHIKVYRYDFEPLVARSISDYILLVAAPAEFFTAEIEALASPKVTLSMLKDFSRYIRVNRFIIDQVIREIEASGYSETFGGETIRFMRKAINENPDRLEQAEVVLSGLLRQQTAAITDFVCQPKPLVSPPVFLDTPKLEAWAVTEYVPIPQPEVKQAQDFPVQKNENEFLIPEAETEPEEELSLGNAVSEEEVQFPVSEEVNEPMPENPAAESPSEDVFQRHFHETIKASRPEVADLSKDTLTLNDSLRSSEKSALATGISASAGSAAPFRTLVPMHYRFTFINSLFDGNQDAWTEAVERIDSTSSLEEAVSVLKAEYAERFDWAGKEDNVMILFNYVERKF